MEGFSKHCQGFHAWSRGFPFLGLVSNVPVRCLAVEPVRGCVVVFQRFAEHLLVYNVHAWDFSSVGGVPLSHTVPVPYHGDIQKMCFIGPGSTEVVAQDEVKAVYIVNVDRDRNVSDPRMDSTCFRFECPVVNFVAHTDLIGVETDDGRMHVLRRTEGAWRWFAWSIPGLLEDSLPNTHRLVGGGSQLLCIGKNRLSVVDVTTGSIVDSCAFDTSRFLYAIAGDDGSVWLLTKVGRGCRVHRAMEDDTAVLQVAADPLSLPQNLVDYIPGLGFLRYCFLPNLCVQMDLVQTESGACARAFRPMRHAWLHACVRSHVQLHACVRTLVK